MSLSSTRTAIVRVLSIMVAGVIGFAVASSPSYAQQEEQWQLFVKPPENVRTVWFLQARHVASELELDREAARQLSRAYFSARQEHREKVEALPRTGEGFRDFWRIGEEARSSLEKSLVEALGKEKGQKAAVALGAFNFLSDNIAADILAAQQKALASVFDYQENVNKAVQEARESGSWEEVREKFSELTMKLAEKVSAIFSEKQMSEWEEKYRPFFERILSL